MLVYSHDGGGRGGDELGCPDGTNVRTYTHARTGMLRAAGLVARVDRSPRTHGDSHYSAALEMSVNEGLTASERAFIEHTRYRSTACVVCVCQRAWVVRLVST